jgi:hypothetical protein
MSYSMDAMAIHTRNVLKRARGRSDFADWPEIRTNPNTSLDQFVEMYNWLIDRVSSSEIEYILHVEDRGRIKYYSFFIRNRDVAMHFKLLWI